MPRGVSLWQSFAAIRPAVIWLPTSFGSQTQAGSTFVSRMLTVVTSLKFQRRNVLEFMTNALTLPPLKGVGFR